MAFLPADHDERGTMLISVGLIVLLVSFYLPALPVLTGMALVALGATRALCCQRFSSLSLLFAIAIHLFVYFSLYLIFVGAVVHAATTGGQNCSGVILLVDIITSALLIAIAIRKAVKGMLGAPST